MAMGHERSKSLHNFTLPCGLKWGNQKFLRCAKVDSNGEIVSPHRRSNGSELIGRRKEVDVVIHHRRDEVGFSRKFRSAGGYNGAGGGGGGGDGIAAVREKLMFDLQTEADKMKDAIFRDGLEEKQQEEEVYPSPAPATASVMTAAAVVTVDTGGSRPWNLRTRRAACKAPINGIAGGGGSNGTLKVDVMKTNNGSSFLRTENKSPRLRSEFSVSGVSFTGEKRKRSTFSVSLGRREIDEDFMAIAGHRPPRRAKKRAKLVQKNLDTLFPGLWLTEVTPDLYKVPDDQ